VTHGQCDARRTVTFQAAEHQAPWPVPNYTAWRQAHGCEQLAQSCYSAAERPGVKPATSWSLVESACANCRLNVYMKIWLLGLGWAPESTEKPTPVPTLPPIPGYATLALKELYTLMHSVNLLPSYYVCLCGLCRDFVNGFCIWILQLWLWLQLNFLRPLCVCVWVWNKLMPRSFLYSCECTVTRQLVSPLFCFRVCIFCNHAHTVVW